METNNDKKRGRSLVAFFLGIICGKKVLPFLIHVLYIALIAISLFVIQPIVSYGETMANKEIKGKIWEKASAQDSKALKKMKITAHNYQTRYNNTNIALSNCEQGKKDLTVSLNTYRGEAGTISRIIDMCYSNKNNTWNETGCKQVFVNLNLASYGE